MWLESNFRPNGGHGLRNLHLVLLTLVGVAARPEEDTAQPRNDQWAFRQLVRPAVPEVENRRWPRNPIDHFVGARLAAEELSPAGEADRTTLIRRLSFDLVGLPPTPEEVRRFVSDPGPDAYEQLVDRILASPRHGERWSRHWLGAVPVSSTH